jgi:hypothetical protein
VVTVHALHLELALEDLPYDGDGGVHHPLPVRPREPLGPKHVGHVGVELRTALAEPSQVLVFQYLALFLGDQLGCLDVVSRQLVADAPAAGVQHQPHPLSFVHTDLEEVVARTQASELDDDLLLLARRELGFRTGRETQGTQGLGLGPLAPLVAFADSGRDPIAQHGVHPAQVVG